MSRSALRKVWRAARDVPILGSVLQILDRVWWYRVIVRSTLVDPEYYAAQCGRQRAPRGFAILHYVFFGFRRGYSLNPLFDEIFAGGGLPEVFRVPAMYAYLVSDRPTVAVHPWWDAVSHSRVLTTRLPGLEAVWADREQAVVDLEVGETRLTVRVDELRSWALQAAREWGHGDLRGDRPLGRPSATTSVVRVVQQRDRRYARRLAQAARRSFAGDEAVVVMVEPDASQWVSARLLARLVPELRVTGVERGTTWARLVGRLAAESSGDVMAVLDARVDLADDELERLIEQAHDGSAVIPCSRDLDGTLVGVGAAHIGASLPWRILGEHPREDLAALGEGKIDVPLLTGRTFAMPRRLLTETTVWDMTLVNDGELEVLSIHLRRQHPSLRLIADRELTPVQDEPERAFRTRRRERYVAAVRDLRPERDDAATRLLIDRAGFDVRAWPREGSADPTPTLVWRRPDGNALRWAIKICAPAGRQGAVWGDTHFAEGLAAALRRRGQYVVIDAFDARARRTSYLDDVSVVIRGPYRIDPPPTGMSMQWIISHPDQITADELRRFDRVFAASERWPEKIRRQWGIEVETLLEATDADLFHPRGLPRNDDIVFVGTARGLPRPSVVEPIRAGVPVKVYGPDWRPFIPASAIEATYLPNSDLSARYETASIVLNDQWPAMRREGFIAMRPFDVVAAGGRVVSERVDGIEKIFGAALVAYDTTRELVQILRTDPRELFASDEELRSISARIRRDHSFDARADRLLEIAADGIEGAVVAASTARERGRGQRRPT